jgi:predicted nucleic acid-binding protein
LITAVDTNILLDILIPDQTFQKESLLKLETASSKGKIIICEIVFTELASQFANIRDLNNFLNHTCIEVIISNKETFFSASRIWRDYCSKYKKEKFCPECGIKINIRCPKCSKEFNRPRRILNDFIIASHAKSFADVFLTRDLGFYRKYFSDLKIL